MIRLRRRSDAEKLINDLREFVELEHDVEEFLSLLRDNQGLSLYVDEGTVRVSLRDKHTYSDFDLTELIRTIRWVVK